MAGLRNCRAGIAAATLLSLHTTETAMLPCQRALFDIPREVCFLNAASWSPLPLAVQEAGRAAVAHKGQPWKLPADFQPKQYERARRAAASLVGADPVDVALIPSVGYGVSTAGKVL